MLISEKKQENDECDYGCLLKLSKEIIRRKVTKSKEIIKKTMYKYPKRETNGTKDPNKKYLQSGKRRRGKTGMVPAYQFVRGFVSLDNHDHSRKMSFVTLSWNGGVISDWVEASESGLSGC